MIFTLGPSYHDLFCKAILALEQGNARTKSVTKNEMLY